MALGGLVLGSLILCLKGMRIMMFQLSGYYCRGFRDTESDKKIEARNRIPKSAQSNPKDKLSSTSAVALLVHGAFHQNNRDSGYTIL